MRWQEEWQEIEYCKTNFKYFDPLKNCKRRPYASCPTTLSCVPDSNKTAATLKPPSSIRLRRSLVPHSMLCTAQSSFKEETVEADIVSGAADRDRAWVSIRVKSSLGIGEWTPSNKVSGSPNEALDNNRWSNVKTWTFVQLLASSFAKVLLENAMESGGDSPGEKKPAINDWDCSYIFLKAMALPSVVSSPSTVAPKADTKSSNGTNKWDYFCNGSFNGLKSVVSRPRISASSSSTLLLDTELDSIEEDLKHGKTVEKDLEEEDAVCRDPTRYVFDIISIIGSGSYGTVLLCRLRACPTRLFAVKVVYKSKLGSTNGMDGDGKAMREAERLLTEKRVLCSVSHPFITRMFCSFETPNALNFVLEYCPGGDMYFLLEKFVKNRLPEDHALFYAASIVLALRYLHGRGILYGDLKPENILLDEAGFVRLADFGFAREQMHRSDQSCTSFCGSADYNAPEVVRGTGYGLAADLWSFGCVVYELLTGYPPFYSPRDHALLVRKINEEEPSFPKHFSLELCNLLSGLLHKDVKQRLGNGPNGMQDILDHPFFANINWYRLETKRVTPPIVPKLASKLDTSNFECQFTSQQVEGHLVYDERRPASIVSKEEENQSYFEDFDWCANASHFL